jgi:hypothetical protein
MQLSKYSIGTGDRFGQQGKAQLKAVQKADEEFDTLITPVWNKSNREHQIIGTEPENVREEADAAVSELGWNEAYFVDADHISEKTVDPYISCSNFFTIDVADYIGEKSAPEDKKAFIEKNADSIGSLSIPGISEEFNVTKDFLSDWADQYLLAIKQARKIYEYIRDRKSGSAVFEISIDEVENPQKPIELYFILKTVAEEGIAINTIAPKFTGDFYKGVDYVGDIDQFEKEFEQDILVISHAIEEFGLPSDLKLSVHSGSDKFSLYPRINALLEKYNAGVHLKTAGTTWLEELIGIAEFGQQGLEMAKKIYQKAFGKYDELTGPYKTVINIDQNSLPSPDEFSEWPAKKIIAKLEHNPDHPEFDSELRQFLHCSYKIAASLDGEFISLLRENEATIGERVTENLYERHICPLFFGV